MTYRRRFRKNLTFTPRQVQNLSCHSARQLDRKSVISSLLLNFWIILLGTKPKPLDTRPKHTYFCENYKAAALFVKRGCLHALPKPSTLSGKTIGRVNGPHCRLGLSSGLQYLNWGVLLRIAPVDRRTYRNRNRFLIQCGQFLPTLSRNPVPDVRA